MRTLSIILSILVLGSVALSQSNQRVKYRYVGADTLQSNTPSSVLTVDDTLAISGYGRVNNIEAKSGDMVAIRDSLSVFGTIKGTNYLWLDGTTGATPTSGTGTRLMWIPAKHAFRAGILTAGTAWDNANVGGDSFALGQDVLASASGSVAIGLSDTATGAVGLILGSSNFGGTASYISVLGGNNNKAGRSNVSTASVITGGDGNTLNGIYSGIFGGEDNSTLGDYVYLMGRNMHARKGSAFLLGIGNSADTLFYGHIFAERNLPFVVMAKDTTVSGLSGTGHGRAYFGLFQENTSDTTAYFLSMQRSSTDYNTGDFVIEKTWGERNTTTFDIPNSYEFFKFKGSNNSLTLTASGGISTPSLLTLSGTAANMGIGANFIGRAGTDAGLSFDASNNTTLSAALTVSGGLTAGGSGAGADHTLYLSGTTPHTFTLQRVGTAEKLAFQANSSNVQMLSTGKQLYIATTDNLGIALGAGTSDHTSISGNLTVSGTVAPGGNTIQGALGVPAVNDTVSWTGQTATIAAQNFANTTTGKLFEVTYYLRTATAGTGTTVTVTVSWNDGAAKTFTSATCDLTSTGNAGYVSGTVPIYVASGTPTFSTTVGAIGTSTYDVRLAVKRLW